MSGLIRPSRFDVAMANNAKDLFDLDDKSRLILACIAREGPQTIYELDKHEDLSQAAIHRRLFGEGILLGQKFLRLEGKASFDRIKRIQRKYYGLDLKGFLASLSEVKCNDNYMFRILLESVCDCCAPRNRPEMKHEEREDFLYHGRIRVMTDLRSFLSYYAKQGVKLTTITNPLLFYLSFWHTPVRLSEDFEPDFVSDFKLVREAFDKMKTKPPDIFNHPWVAPFITCWMTWQFIQKEKLTPGRGVDPDLFGAFLNEYAREIKKLREGKEPPWDYGMLLAGRPIQELREMKMIHDQDVKS